MRRSSLGTKEHGHPRGLDTLLTILAMATLVTFTVVNAYPSTGVTDFWFFLSTGKEIVENGIPHENPFSTTAGLGIVVQQWLWDAILYRLHEAGGLDLALAPGALLTAAALALLIRTLEVFSERRLAPWKEIVVLALFSLGAAPWLVARPHMVTMALLLAVLCVCEKTRHDREARRLALLPALMAVEMQFHMSMSWLLAFVCGVYCLPTDATEWKGLLSPNGIKTHLASRRPFMAALAAMILVIPLNPYGIDGMLYLFKSFGAASYRSVIMEMRPVWLAGFSAVQAVNYFFFGLAAFVALARRRPLRVDLALLVACALLAETLQVRNGWIACIFGSAAIASAAMPKEPANPRGESYGTRSLRLGFAVGSVVAAISCTYSLLAPRPSALPEWTLRDDCLEPLLETLEEDCSSKEARIFSLSIVDYNYLEWRGWKVPLDARPEIWEPRISGADEHAWANYADVFLAIDEGNQDAALDYIERYDYVIVWADAASSSQEAFFKNAAEFSLMGENEHFSLYKLIK